MLEQDQYTIVDSGDGYTVGEISRHPELNYLKDGALVGQFDGVDKMLDYVTSKMPEAKQGKSSTERGRGGFNAFETYEEAIDTFRNSPERVVKFDSGELRIKDESEAGNQVDFDVTGSFIDMGRYMEGIPEVMGDMHNGNSRNRRANLTINLNQIHYISHEDITHRGERILRLVDALEAGGIRTQLTGILSNECGHVEITLKHHEEPLTITDLAVAIHPEFLRRVMFRWNEHSKTWDYGYGSAVAFSHLLSPQLVEGDNVNEMDIVIDSNMEYRESIDRRFDELERLLVWEMSKPVPEVSSIKLDKHGIYFNPNGARSDDEIQREGKEVIREQV